MSVDFNASFSGSAETFGAKMTETPAPMTASMKETGGGSASNYEALRNKPKINGHELIGDMTPAQLGITDDDAPHTGARLETLMKASLLPSVSDAPHTGARLETKPRL